MGASYPANIAAVQIRMARAALRWSIAELSRHAGVAVMTVVRAEGGLPVRQKSLDHLRRTFAASGLDFTRTGRGRSVSIGAEAECLNELGLLASSGLAASQLVIAIGDQLGRCLSVRGRTGRKEALAHLERQLRARIRIEKSSRRHVLEQALQQLQAI
jgi:transcriptional regulator with XRE-family HTH domain